MGGEFTGRNRRVPPVREDAHARVWVEKGIDDACTHTRERETRTRLNDRDRLVETLSEIEFERHVVHDWQST